MHVAMAEGSVRRVALAVAALAALAATVAAAGPAVPDRTVVSWPPSSGSPEALTGPSEVAGPPATFTPVLLGVHTPAQLAVGLPCARTAEPGRVFATTRSAGVAGALEVRAAADEWVVAIDGVPVARFATGAAGCRASFDLAVAGGTAMWTLAVDDREVASGAAPAPVVSGFLVADDVAAGTNATVRTAAASTHPSARQWVLLVLAVIAMAVAFLLAPAGGRPGGGPSEVEVRARPHRTIDRTVVAGLVGWGLLGPWFFDDGWLLATVRAREGSGSFSNYFDTLGTQMPLGFAQHVLLWPFAAAGAPFLAWRAVPVAACIASWFVLRRLLVRACRPLEPPRSAVVGLALVHLLASTGFLITLRPEPTVALLTLLVLDRSLAHVDTGSVRSFGFAVVPAAVSCTLHPSGFVALAALLPAARAGFGWFSASPVTPRTSQNAGRGDGLLVPRLAMLLCGAATGIVLLFADTDLAHWRRARAAFAADGFHDNGPLDDLDRYRDLLANGTMAMLATVLLGGFALVSWALAARRAVRVRRAPEASPAASPAVSLAPGFVLLVAVALLALTPSKWIYHFGSIAGFVALAVAVEVVRLAGASRRTELVGGAVVVAATVLGVRSFTHPKDPQYFLALGRPEVGPLDRPVTWALLGAVALVLTAGPWARSRGRVATWPVLGVAAVVLGATVATAVVVPAVDGPAWATPHALLDDLAGGGCPFARSIDVTDLRTAQPLAPTSGPGGGSVWFASPSPERGDLVLAVRGAPGPSGVRVEWAAGERVVATQTLAPAPRTPSVYGPAPEWQHLRVRRAGRVAPAGADRLRVLVDAGTAEVATPVTVVPRRLDEVLSGRAVLVSPPQLPLLRCTRQPRLAAGIAEVPDAVIGFELHERVVEIPELDSATSPWSLTRDAVATRELLAWITDDRAFTVTVREAG